MPALDFPASPTLGQQYSDWVWDGSKWNFSQTLPGGLPAGSIIQWGGSTAPANWLLCDGSAVSRTTYASLFAAVGTAYGTGDGTTTFNLPDLRGRVPVGKNGGTFGTLGATGGAETHTLSAGEIPSHTHSFSGTTNTTGAHQHNIFVSGTQLQYLNSTASVGTGLGALAGGSNNFLAGTNGDHSHTISGTTGSAGSGAAHNNLQPYQVVNYIIKATAAITAGESELAPRVGVLETTNVLSPNYIINGAFDFNQRGLTSTTNTGYGFDRWATYNSGGTTYSAQTFTPGAAPVAEYEGANYARIVTSGQSGTSAYTQFAQKIEDVRTLSGKTVAVSFWAKAASGTPKVSLELQQNFGAGGSPSSSVETYAGQVTLSTSWTRYSITASIPAITGKTVGTTANSSYTQISLWTSAGTDFNTRAGSIGIQSNTFDFWGVQVEQGTVATPFRRNANSIQGELAACQRYYWRQVATGNDSPFGYGFQATTNLGECSITTPVTMRTNPTSIEFSNVQWTDGVAYNAPATYVVVQYGNAGQSTIHLRLGWTTAQGAGRWPGRISGTYGGAYIGYVAEL